MSTKPLVLITGGTGFVGSHMIWQLLLAGYRVRAAVRPGKAAHAKASYPEFGDRFQVVEIGDIASGDFTEALEGVEAVIHAASPLAFVGDQEYILKSAIDGTTNILQQAVKVPTIKKVVVTSSFVAHFDPDGRQMFSDTKFDHNSWSSITYEEAVEGGHDPLWTYYASKPLAEKTVWEIASQNPSIEFTTVTPPYIFGKYAPRYNIPTKAEDLGTNIIVYSLLNGQYPPAIVPPAIINVEDVARAHLLALETPQPADGSPKRLFIAHPRFSWSEAAAIIREERPELADRVPTPESYVPPEKLADWDTSFAKSALGGFQYTPLKETILAAIDQLIDWEKRDRA